MRRSSLANRLILWFLLIGLGPVLIVGLFTHFISSPVQTYEVNHRLRSIAEAKADKIETYARERTRSVAVLSRLPMVIDALEDLNRVGQTLLSVTTEDKDIDERVRKYLADYMSASGFTNLYLIGERGDIAFAIRRYKDFGTNLYTGTYRNTELARVSDLAKTMLETQISGFEAYPASGLLSAFVAAPVFKDGIIIGVAALQLSNQDIYDIVNDSRNLGNSGQTLIGEQVGDRIIFVTPTRHDKDAAFKRTVTLKENSSFALREAILGRRGVGETVDYRGRDVAASWQYLPSFGWGMVVQMDRAEAFAPIARQQRLMLFVGVAVLIIAVLSAMFIARSIFRPIAELTTAVRRVDGGDLAYQLPVTSGDEIGQLGSAFNKMTAALKGIYDTLEEKVRLRTKDAEEAQKEAEKANEAKSLFLATMSHEIRTPMNAIIGMSGLLFTTLLTNEQKDYARTIRNSSEQLLTIINDILDFSKIEAGKLELEKQAFDLRECVESAVDLLAGRVAEKKLDLLVSMNDEENPPALVGDVTRVRQILVNLLANAVKFTEKGEVVVEVTSNPAGEAAGGPAGGAAGAPRREIHFAVRDTGIGIPADRMDRLFRSFSQVDASTSRRYGGTGLGLAISNRLTEMMGGRMWVESEVGKGSTFHFTIVAPAAPAIHRALREQPQLHGKKVLIVDDNATNRQILALQIRSWKMESESTESPREALQWVEQGKSFDVAILDMQMPDMDGVTLAREIRSRATLPLVMLTSLGQHVPGKEEFEAFLTKPVKASQLYNTLVSIFIGEKVAAELRDDREAPEFDPELASRIPLRILLAEDNAINQKIALLLLKKMGYTADVASNGAEAVQAVRRQHYDVVLMDVQMPEMDGLEATAVIRDQLPANRQPRIIAMTANAMEGDREMCLAARMNDYVSKPIRVGELQSALERCAGVAAGFSRPVEQPLLDQKIWAQLRAAEKADPGILEELAQVFRSETPPILLKVKEAVAAHDVDKLSKAAHNLKGSSANFGMLRLAAVSAELERHARAGSIDAVGELSAIAEREYEMALKVLDQELGKT